LKDAAVFVFGILLRLALNLKAAMRMSVWNADHEENGGRQGFAALLKLPASVG
jgi:hypothetical protein